MRLSNSRNLRGFTLPAILVVMGALLILAVGVLLVTSIERSTSRSFVDRQRADLAARAGLEDVKGLLKLEAANDDFLVIQGTDPVVTVPPSKKEAIPYLYLARGSGGGSDVSYRYLPMYSTKTAPAAPKKGEVEAPLAKDLVGADTKDLTTLPWHDPAKIAWIEIPDARGKIVSRYAYWVEDLQGKLNAVVAGNVEGTAGLHERAKFPDPGSKPLKKDEPALNVVALHVLDPKSGDTPVGDLTRKVIDGRPAMISPDSILGAAAFAAPQPRSKVTGLLDDPLAASLERNVSPVVKAYREQPIVPFAEGISEDVAGKPKLNLNEMLRGSRPAAVTEFANWVGNALPKIGTKQDGFESRKGGFPEDYLKTLAANAFDYADTDSEPSVSPGSYRGVDSYPFLSEIVLKIEYLGPRIQRGRLILDWRFKLFGEFWNMSNQPVKGKARLSYEVALNHTPIGSGVRGINFDDPSILSDPKKSTHLLDLIDGRYFSKEQDVELLADQYKFYQFASVDCSIDVAPNNVSYNTDFILQEKLASSGVSVRWNDVETERIPKIVRDVGAVESREMVFTILYKKNAGKAGIPGHGYGPFGDFVNNMGDPRMSHYYRNVPLSENSLKNLSPYRRNVRRSTIYNFDDNLKRVHYGRVLPSEWPDGGHDAAIGTFFQPPFSDLEVEPNAVTYQTPPPSNPGNAPSRISNAGRFHSVTELGNVYDPVMWSPAYIDLPNEPGSGDSDTKIINLPWPGKAKMPQSRNVWPEVTTASALSFDSGGGNTLRIGRPEHQRLDRLSTHAAHLLDLFHAGDVDSTTGQGPESTTVNINGHINVNTAEKGALRAMAAGMLKQDPELRNVTSWAHEVTNGNLSPATARLEIGSPTLALAADRIADALILSRPFASMKELATAKIEPKKVGDLGESVFGNKSMYSQGANLQWSDAAAEEIFARVYDASTLRSRNFRVWAIGQSIVKAGTSVEVLAESRRAYTVFADPGERKPDGSIDPAKFAIRTTYENDF